VGDEVELTRLRSRAASSAAVWHPAEHAVPPSTVDRVAQTAMSPSPVGRNRRIVGVSLGIALSVAALLPSLDRVRAARTMCRRLDKVERAVMVRGSGTICATRLLLEGAAALRVARLGPLLASWETIGGCGAGSTVGTGGIKWIGRNVSGGLFGIQVQANYTPAYDSQRHLDTGYGYTVLNQVSRDLGEKLRVGIIIPYVYKYIRNPVGLGFDVSNRGLGDINALVTRRLGAINDTTVTLSIGFPTGTYDAGLAGGSPFPQDKQLGAGRFSAAALVDHTIDNDWGPSVFGGVVSYPGGENSIQNYRSPNATVYAFAGYLLGPFVPAAGLSATRYWDHDRDTIVASDRPLTLGAVNTSIEWSNSYVALLAGFSQPFTQNGRAPWTAGVGLSAAPF
jgi:hypothetical protein